MNITCCDECGARLTSNCVMCSAPVCCPQCCKIDFLMNQLKLGRKDGMEWRDAALALGETLTTQGPDRYYEHTPDLWLAWAKLALKKVYKCPNCCTSMQVDNTAKPAFCNLSQSQYDQLVRDAMAYRASKK